MQQEGRGRFVKEASSLNHVNSISGTCLFGYLSTHVTFVPDFLAAVTGRAFDVQEMLKVGERVANIRQAFNVREGINFVTQPIPERAFGRPPLPDGPTAGVRLDIEGMRREHLEEMGWTQDAAVPEASTLFRLGMADVAQDLWGEDR
jgi:aldehyde:ferredoxin oxidoreductase